MHGLQNIYYTLLLSFIWISNSFSQEKAIFTNHYLDPFIVNPACSGADYYTVAHLSVKKQWLGFSNSPSSFFLSGNFRIGEYDFYDPKGFVNQGPLKIKDRIGIGAAVFQDINGPLSNTGGILSYAYHVPINKESRLSFGMSAIIMQYSLNNNLLQPDQINDPYLFTGNNSIFNINFGFGVYYHNYDYFTGLSIIKVLPSISNVNETSEIQPSIFFIGGYKFNRASKSFNFEPSLTIKKLGNELFMADAHAKLYIKRLNWIAFSYSTTQRINFQFGLRMYKMTYIGYNFEFNVSKIAAFNYGSHEISLGINLGLIGIEGIRETIRNSNK